MQPLPSRRFGKLHEQILLSRTFSLLVGWFCCVVIPLGLHWDLNTIITPDLGQQTAIIVTTIAFLLSNIGIHRLLAVYPGGSSASMVSPQVLICYTGMTVLALLLRVDVSRLLLVSSGVAALIWFHVEYIFSYKFRRPKLAIVPGGFTAALLSLEGLDARPLTELRLNDVRYDGVVADFNSLTPEKERFLAGCALQRIAVYDAKFIYESFTGRVKIERMSENNIGSLLPSLTYIRVKALMDLGLVICLLPIAVPLALVTALLIRWETPGPIIYRQPRVGLGNKPFVIYKFRSMRCDEIEAEQFAGENDPRITRVGKWIRKLRIDELPQFLNVLKGDMSLIGPRPEQQYFVDQFNEQIPFYSYRHVVKPGITGWAQVRHGYAGDADETRIKIEHDFYYIKHCSIFLDIFIIFLTIRTILTGFGAR